MRHIITRKEYKELVESLLLKSRRIDEDFGYIAEYWERCRYWDTRIVGINHLLSIILEQLAKHKSISDLKSLIDLIKTCEMEMAFEISDGQIAFIESLMRVSIGSQLDLEDLLVIAEDEIYGR